MRDPLESLEINPLQEGVAEWETTPASPAPNRVRFFTCSAAERAKVEGVLGTSTTVAALRKGVDRAAARAVNNARRTAAALRARPRGARINRLFRAAFGVPATTVPSWRPKSATWSDLGDLVAIRLENAAKILDGGWIKYFCWGSATHCSECTGAPTTYRACSSWKGRYLICIGREFWTWFRHGRFARMAGTLLHEALHIYFRLTVGHGPRRLANANCYVLLAWRFNSQAMTPCLRERCVGTPC
jgi:hypothetical protein